MTRQDYIKKWFTYTLALLFVWLVDCTVVCRYTVFGVHAVLMPVAVAAVATLESPTAGGCFGMGVGLWWYATYADVPAGQIFLLCVTGALLGMVTRYALNRSLIVGIISAAGAMLIQEGVHVMTYLFLRKATFNALLAVALPEFLLSLLFAPLVYGIFYLAFRRVGGTRLAD